MAFLSFLLLSVVYILIAYLYSSTVVFIYFIYTKRDLKDLDDKPLFGIKFLNKNFFEIGTFLACIYFLQAGAERALFFIPGDWGGYDEEGEWQMARKSLSYTLSLLLTIFLAELVHRANKFNNNNRRKIN